MATRLLLVRHGESRAQVDGIAAGHATCRGLSERGRAQAAALAERLARTGEAGDIDVVHTSLLARAQETARAVSTALALPVPREDCAWCEIHPGDADGHGWLSVRDLWPASGDPDDLYRRRLPGMETWAEMCVRVGAGLRTLVHESGTDSVLVVGSGGTVGASFVALGDAPMSQLIGFTRGVGNASITEWLLVGGRWELGRYNDTGHLTS